MEHAEDIFERQRNRISNIGSNSEENIGEHEKMAAFTIRCLEDCGNTWRFRQRKSVNLLSLRNLLFFVRPSCFGFVLFCFPDSRSPGCDSDVEMRISQ